MPYALALGFFDGVHIGHAALLDAVIKLARRSDLEPAVCTLDRSPAAAFGRGDPRLINSPDDRRYILKRFFGIDDVFELRFDTKMQSLAPQDFVPMLMRDCDARALVAGYNYRFGSGGMGGSNLLKCECYRMGLGCCIVQPVETDGEPVSSTRIRRLIEQGDMTTAQQLLGHPHLLGGTVEHGRALGHTLGFPTVNLPIPDGVIAPRYGVYAVRVDVGGELLDGVANVGEKPTVGGAAPGVEAHIFDFDRDMYGEEIVVQFDEFIRPERKFDSIDELKEQVERDKLTAAALLARTTD